MQEIEALGALDNKYRICFLYSFAKSRLGYQQQDDKQKLNVSYLEELVAWFFEDEELRAALSELRGRPLAEQVRAIGSTGLICVMELS